MRTTMLITILIVIISLYVSLEKCICIYIISSQYDQVSHFCGFN